MPIRPPELRTNLLRVGGDSAAILGFQAIAARPDTEDWLLLIDLAPGQYGMLNIKDLTDSTKAQITANPNLALRAIAAICLTADSEEDDATSIRARHQAARDAGQQISRYVIVLRDGEPIGAFLARRPGGSVLSDASDFLRGIKNVPNPGSQPREIQQRADRYVNTDIADGGNPDQVVARTIALTAGTRYYFRIRIGEIEATSIEATPTALQAELLTEDIELQVVLFSEDFDLEANQGTIFVPVTGAAYVRSGQHASLPAGLDSKAQLVTERLLFAITPLGGGVASLRCNLYCRGMLIQSRLISVVVGASEALDAQGTMRRSVLDFNLSTSLAPSVLDQLEPHRLSLMLNTTADGTHAFRLVATDGQELFSNSATLSPTEISNLIELARERLRLTCWGKSSEWNNDTYRYDPTVSEAERAKRFGEDIIALARRGAILYSTAVKDLVGGVQGQRELRKLMRTPGMVQLASKISANDIVPIAMFYDYKLDSQEPNLKICPEFEASLNSGRPLLDEPCFKGECACANGEDLTVVCPAGFWGFRHNIGMPYPVRSRGPEVVTRISYSGIAQMDVAFYSDFPQIKPHLAKLPTLGYQVTQASPRKEVLSLLQKSTPQLVYFYCHGADSNSIPFLRVGGSSNQDYLSTDNFANYEIGWPDQRPLVFINGCHTTSLTPDKALGFVKAFVEDTSAAGVIGTEITIFEPLAQTFAETFLPLFLAGTPIGLAIRTARLTLLAQRNPLGLVYMPHAYAGLTLATS